MEITQKTLNSLRYLSKIDQTWDSVEENVKTKKVSPELTNMLKWMKETPKKLGKIEDYLKTFDL